MEGNISWQAKTFCSFYASRYPVHQGNLIESPLIIGFLATFGGLVQKISVAAISCRNLIGEVQSSLADMEKWVSLVCDKGAELVLFPELNVTGYIAAPAARRFAQTIPGPITDQVFDIARQHQTILSCGLVEREGDEAIRNWKTGATT